MKIEKQLEKFIKSGLKEMYFTQDLYVMLHIHTNRFIAHFNKKGFYQVRFLEEADKTISMLRAVSNPYYKVFCDQLADEMEFRLAIKEVVTQYSTIVNE